MVMKREGRRSCRKNNLIATKTSRFAEGYEVVTGACCGIDFVTQSMICTKQLPNSSMMSF